MIGHTIYLSNNFIKDVRIIDVILFSIYDILNVSEGGKNMLIKETGKITQKGQLTIPVSIRNKLNIEEGDRLRIIVDDNGETKVEVLKRKKLKDVFGILGKPPQNADMSIDEAIDYSRKQKGRIATDEDGC